MRLSLDPLALGTVFRGVGASAPSPFLAIDERESQSHKRLRLAQIYSALKAHVVIICNNK